jgi:DNA primase
MALPPRFLDELRERVPVSAVVGRQVKLARKGREFTGLCPFHNEKSPSFFVNDEKGFYHCFGCGAHGDAIGFLVASEGLGFREAVERVAGIAGLSLPAESPQAAERAVRASGLHEVVEAACAWFEQQLRMPEGRAALDYLRGRGLDEATIRRFRLGFAPDRRGALQAALQRDGVGPDLLVEAGLLKRAEDDPARLYEYFRGRVMFPIADRRSKVVAFGGRIMGDGQPKYLNSPDNPLFHKGRTLFNLDKARDPARQEGAVVVVEGYMDVIGLARAGIHHAVAPLGTALTEDQLDVLWRLVPEPVLCFDGDTAGQRAAARAAERAIPLLQPGRSLHFATLPTGEDPDSLVATRGPQAFRDVISAAIPLVDLVWNLEIARGPADTPERRADVAARLDGQASRVVHPGVQGLYRSEYRNRLREAFAPPRPQWREKRGDTRGGKGEWRVRPQPRAAIAPGQVLPSASPDMLRRRLHEGILAALINHPLFLHEFGEFLASLDSLDAALDRLRRELLNVASVRPELDVDTLVAHLSEQGLGEILGAVRRSEVYQLSSFAHPSASDEDVRRRLQQLAATLEHGRIVAELRTRVADVRDEAGYARVVSFVESNLPAPDDGSGRRGG